MRHLFRMTGLAAALVCAPTLVHANNISSAFASNGTAVNMGPVSDLQLGTQLAGATATAVFANNIVSPIVCVFSGNTCTGGIPIFLGTFTVTAPTGDTSQKSWTVANDFVMYGMPALTSLTIDLKPGQSAFNPCMSDGGPNISPTSCVSLSAGAGNALSVSAALDGTAGVVASAGYTNIVSNSGGDLYSQMALTFGGANFVSGNSFTFNADTDISGDPSTDPGPAAAAPEPGPSFMVGTGLAFLGIVRLRQKRLNQDKLATVLSNCSRAPAKK